MLKVKDVHAAYGLVKALHGVSLEVPTGSVVALLGANGAGKTSVLRVVSGMLRPLQGAVLYKDENVTGLPPSELVRRGVVHVPEGRHIFGELTVEENLMLGAYSRPWGQEVKADLERVYGYFPRLGERRRQRAGTLSGGEQQMLAIGRALMARAQLMLLDEPSLGLAPTLVEELYEVISRLNREEGTTILVVEQNAAVALEVAHYAYVLEVGQVVMAGPAGILKEDEEVRRIYLGQ